MNRKPLTTFPLQAGQDDIFNEATLFKLLDILITQSNINVLGINTYLNLNKYECAQQLAGWRHIASPGMLIGDRNLEITTRRKGISQSMIYSDYEYHNYHYSGPLPTTLFQLGWKCYPSTIYLLISQSFSESRKFLLLKETSSSDRVFLPVAVNFFLLMKSLSVIGNFFVYFEILSFEMIILPVTGISLVPGWVTASWCCS